MKGDGKMTEQEQEELFRAAHDVVKRIITVRKEDGNASYYTEFPMIKDNDPVEKLRKILLKVAPKEDPDLEKPIPTISDLKKKYPVVGGKDHGKRVTLGSVIENISLALEGDDKERRNVACDVIDRDFLFGAWGDRWDDRDWDLLKDIRGMIIGAYRAGSSVRGTRGCKGMSDEEIELLRRVEVHIYDRRKMEPRHSCEDHECPECETLAEIQVLRRTKVTQ